MTEQAHDPVVGLADLTKDTLAAVREALEECGYRQTAVDRHEAPDDLPIAVESGYVYGEVTVKIWQSNTAGRNTGVLQVVRGVGTQLADDVMEAVGMWADVAAGHHGAVKP